MSTQNEPVTITSGSNSAWPSIEIGLEITVVGRAENCTVRIPHISVSWRHLQLHRNGKQIEIEDLESRFGTFVNGVRIHKKTLCVDDTIRFGSSPPYRFGGDRLEVMFNGIGMEVSLNGVAISRGGRALVENVNLDISSGSFVGLLGPSGSGKSLLLGCLSTTVEPSSGLIAFDGGLSVAEHRDYYRSSLGIVPQEDLIFEDLTILENLRAAAQIRLSGGDANDERISAALESVSMVEHRRKIVSVLSGGQKKRVSIAIELLLRPRLLLLDEPTSGLDPGMQARLMEMLRRLARQGVTVVCTTHTLDTLNFLDSVIVLGRHGESTSVSFSGDPHELLPAFGVANQADLFEKLQQQRGTARPAGEVAHRDSFSSETETRGEPKRFSAPGIARDRASGRRRFQQISVIWRRSLRTLLRDRTSLILAALLPCVLSTLAMLSQSHHSRSVFSVFFLVISMLWLGMTLTVREIVRERKLYVRDRLAGLDPDAHLAGKVLYGLTVVSVQAAILWTTAKIVAGLTLEATAAEDYYKVSSIFAWMVLVSVGFAGAILGLVFSVCTKSERAAVAFLPLALIPQMLFSRVAYGDGDQGWNAPSLYGPIINGISPFKQQSLVQWLDYAISLPMVSRPGTAILAYNSDSNWARMSGETVYLIVLVMAYMLGLYLLFRWLEPGWAGLRQ